MQLDRIQIPLATRNPWSAIDLGFAMARRWWLPMFLVWLIPSAILYLVLAFAIRDYPYVSILLVWLCKPLLDQLPLFIGSQKLFDEKVTVQQTLRRMLSIFRKDWWQWLTIRRFSLVRSFDLPISTLEQLSGSQRSERKRVLHPTFGRAASWLTIVCLHFEYIAVYGLMSMVYLMLPEYIEVDWMSLLVSETTPIELAANGLFILAMAAIAPFYTMAGFSLYLHRRIELEGWDIELQFRQLAVRQQQVEATGRKTGSNIAALLMVAVCVCATLSPLASIAANSNGEMRISPTDSRELITEVLNDPVFHETETVRTWQRKNTDEQVEEDDATPSWLYTFIKFIEVVAKAVSVIGPAVEVIFWVIAVSAIVWLGYRFRSELQSFVGRFGTSVPQQERPDTLFGMEVTRESMPEDVASTVQSLWQKERHREAIGLMYRYSLYKLLHEHGCNFVSSDTEFECLQKVDRLGSARLLDVFSQLTSHWQQLAWGHMDISQSRFEQLHQYWRKELV